ncbi:MAG TPA: error-prone DNA polymerase [Acidobacteriota bacterium]|nr:error-prone DNA polymerase [Acidobacteriota bacterium]
MNYTELHCHSNFSFLDGASHPEALVERAYQLGYPALALTDHNGLYGIVRFSQAALSKGIKPIFGAEITLDDDHHLLLLVKNPTGYANLSRLLSEAQLKSKKGEARVTRDLLDGHREGIIALSGCMLGEIPKALLDGNTNDARRAAARYRELFGRDNFYLELQHHNLPMHQTVCAGLARLGRALDIPLVATNNAHYAAPEDRPLQDVLTCIRHHTTLDDARDLLYPNAERYLKSAEQMSRQFARLPEAIENTQAITEQCWFMLRDLKTSLPDFPTPDGQSTRACLRHLTYRGAKKRYGELTAEVVNQLEHELRLINKLDLTGYFLIVRDIARFCNENGILCQGRGSAANSAVCYCLEITAVDPIRLRLLFERFISEERSEPPDIDIDIANNRREEVIQYVYNKYGREHAAMVCEVITYRGRSAVRDIAKVLGFSLEETGKLAKLLDHYSNSKELEERVRETRLNTDNKRVRLLIDLCRRIRRFPRHLGIHVGGMIITKKPLTQIVPIENATMPDRSVIQWDKDDTGEVRLVKIDLLGLGMLSLIDTAFKMIEKHRGIRIDPAGLTYDDPKVYDLVCSADTVGIFQIESRAQMNTLPRHRPRCFYDLVVEVALIRPGPIQGDMVHPYLRRRNGEEKVTYPHSSLEPILKRTLGVPLFQEQGMQIAVAAAGFTPSQADELRRAMGHKRSKEKMDALKERLIVGMLANGIDEQAACRIFVQMAAFADFGFAESHAASFALLVYVSAFLKVYYPQEFYCALLNSQPMGFYSPSTIVYEARQRGIRMLGVDVSTSRWDCTVEGDKVRLGFRYVKSLGPAAKEKIEYELEKGPFVSPADFVFRTRLDQDCFEQLALIGAFRCFGLTRRQALWEILSLSRKSDDELSLTVPEESFRLLRPMALGERLAADFRGMELSTGPHPMALLRRRLEREGILSSNDLKTVPGRRTVRVAGVVVIRQRPVTARGFLFVTLEDETGFANIVVKPNYMQRCRRAIVYSKALVVRGTVEKKDGVINVIGCEFTPLRMTRNLDTPRSRDFR